MQRQDSMRHHGRWRAVGFESSARALGRNSGLRCLTRRARAWVPRCVGGVTVLIEISGCSGGFAADQAVTLMPRLEMGHTSQHVA